MKWYYFELEIIELRKEAPLQKLLIDEFGGWPVLESANPNGFKWNASTFDWQVFTFCYRDTYLSLFSRYDILSTFLYYLQKTIIRLRQYNNDILVALWVGPDIQDSDEHIVQVSVGVLNFQRHTFSKERLCKIEQYIDLIQSSLYCF